MVLSCLVEPLVAPLTGRSASRGSALSGSRLATTALAVGALLTLAQTAEARALAEQGGAPKAEAAVVHNAHAKPAPLPYRVLFQVELAIREEDAQDLLAPPAEAPSFEQHALDAHRLRHRRDIIRDGSPSLGLGRRLDRLFGGTSSTYLRFGSGRFLAGLPVLS